MIIVVVRFVEKMKDLITGVATEQIDPLGRASVLSCYAFQETPSREGKSTNKISYKIYIHTYKIYNVHSC